MPEAQALQPTTDTERLDWMKRNEASFQLLRDSGPTLPYAADGNSKAFREGMRVQLFTCASQHVYGLDLRDAIRAAVEEAAQRERLAAIGTQAWNAKQ